MSLNGLFDMVMKGKFYLLTCILALLFSGCSQRVSIPYISEGEQHEIVIGNNISVEFQ
jgi:hypothetical protein